MQPKIEDRKSFTVVGMKYTGKDTQELPGLWQKFNPRAQEIKNIVNPTVCYGFTPTYDVKTKTFDYIACIEVSAVEDIPQGMVSAQVPAGKYAAFPTSLPKFMDTFKIIHETWLPDSDYQRAGMWEFEQYDEHFDIQDPHSGLLYCIPIK